MRIFVFLFTVLVSINVFASSKQFKEIISIGGHDVVFEGEKSEILSSGKIKKVIYSNLKVYFHDDPDRLYYLRAAYGLDSVVFNDLCKEFTNEIAPISSIDSEAKSYLSPTVFYVPDFLVLYEGRSFRQTLDFSNLHYSGFTCSVE